MLQAIFVDGVDAITVSGLTQWDTGQKLEIKLASLPATFQVHFANKRDTTAYVVEGKATDGIGVVSIPNVILQKSVDAKAWIYVIDSNSAETIKTIELPIIPRAKPSDYAYEETEILNYETVIAKAEVLAEAAAQSEANAQKAATTAIEAAQTAENAKVYVNTIVAGNEAYTKRESDLKYAPTISVGVSGKSIVVQDSADNYLQDVNIYGNSMQDGTPTPDNPQDIVSVGDNGNITIFDCNKNLAVIKRKAVLNNGIEYTFNADGSITANGTATAQSYIHVVGALNYEANTEYIVSGCPNNVNGACFIQANYYDENGTQTAAQDRGNGKTFTNVKSGEMILYIFVDSGKTVNNVTFYPMIRKAEIADNEYSSPVGTSITIPLAEPLRAIDSIKDEITQQGGVYGVYRRLSTVVLDGSEEWSVNTYVSNQYCFTLKGAKQDSKVICDCYKYNKGNDIAIDTYILLGSFLNIRNVNINTVEELQESLAKNPITVVYQLATPVFEPFDEETNNAIKSLMSYKPVTTIYNSEGAEMDVEYSADTKIYIDNKFTELQAALISAGANI